MIDSCWYNLFRPQYKRGARNHASLHFLGECCFVLMTCHRCMYINTLSEVSGLCFWLSHHHWTKFVTVHYGVRSAVGSFLTRTLILRFMGLQSWQYAQTLAMTQVIIEIIISLLLLERYLFLKCERKHETVWSEMSTSVFVLSPDVSVHLLHFLL